MYRFIRKKIDVEGIRIVQPIEDYREVIRAYARQGYQFKQVFAPTVKTNGFPEYYELIFQESDYRYEYKVVRIECKVMIKSLPTIDYFELIMKEEIKGWYFVQLFAPPVQKNGLPQYYDVIFERYYNEELMENEIEVVQPKRIHTKLPTMNEVYEQEHYDAAVEEEDYQSPTDEIYTHEGYDNAYDDYESDLNEDEQIESPMTSQRQEVPKPEIIDKDYAKRFFEMQKKKKENVPLKAPKRLNNIFVEFAEDEQE